MEALTPTSWRAVVASPDFQFAYSWEWSGAIWRVDRTTGARRKLYTVLHSQKQFNRMLRLLCIRPLVTAAEIREKKLRKRLDKYVEDGEAITL